MQKKLIERRRISFMGENNPKFVEFHNRDKIKVLYHIGNNFNFNIKDSKNVFGISEYKIRSFLKDCGLPHFQTVKKENKHNWKEFIFNIILSNFRDVSEILNVKKWEPIIPACLRGRVKGNFPIEIPKTDQERIQNLSKYFDRIKEQEWEITEKLHGSSFSAILDMGGNFHVCSRNLDLQYEENNAYWKVALNYNLEEKMQKHNLQGYAIQGELVGEGVNGNQYGIKGLDLYVFDIYSVKDNRYLSPSERIDIVNTLQLKHVPVVSRGTKIQVDSIQELLKLVDGKKSSINGSNIEGWVFKTEDMCYDDRDVKSFKVISNTWLLKNE